jgi:hypothetical protein
VQFAILPRNAVPAAPAFANMNLFGNMLVTFETPAGAFHLIDEKTLNDLVVYFEDLDIVSVRDKQATITLERAQQYYADLL